MPHVKKYSKQVFVASSKKYLKKSIISLRHSRSLLAGIQKKTHEDLQKKPGFPLKDRGNDVVSVAK